MLSVRIHRFLPPLRLRLIFAALMVVACDTGTVGFSGPNGQQAPTGPDSTSGLTLTINPNPVRIAVGATGQFTARLQDALGNVLSDPVTWGTNNPGIATIDNTGVVTGVGAGTTNITASEHGVTSTASVEVDPVPVASVAISPRTDTLQVGTQVTLTAVTKDALGNTLTGRQITWTSQFPSFATVNASGTVTAVAVGVDSVTATSEGVSSASVITVVNIPVASVVATPTPDTVIQGNTLQLTATPKDGLGNPLTGRTITWSTGNSAVATVSGAGLVTSTGLGTTNITATSGGQSGSASVTVIQAPVASVKVTPANPSVQIGKTVQLTATMRDAKGNTLSGRVVTWGSGTPANATVDGNGLVTGVAAGPSVMTATSEGVPGTTTVTATVPPPTLVRIIMSPDTATINTGATKQFSTVGKYSDSSTSAITPTYTATGGTVSANGLYTAGGTGGTFKVIATSSTFADSSTVTVVKPPVAQVIVTPALDTVTPGTVYQLNAVTKDAGGNVLTGRVITWGSSNPAVATVSSGGAVTAVAIGSATITATSETIPGTATTVVQVILAKSVSITPVGPHVLKGSTITLTATARDAGGNILSGHPLTWNSLSPAIASVNSSGVVTGVTQGTAVVTALVDTAHAVDTVHVDTSTAITPWLLENFSKYTSTANLLADPRGIYSVAEDVYSAGEINLDQTQGSDTVGGVAQSMRYDFPDRTSEGGSTNQGRCTDFTIGRNITLPSQVSEAWIEVEVKFDATWVTLAPSSWGCTSAAAYKFILPRTNVSRFQLVVGIFGGDYTFGYPGNEEPADWPMEWTPFDGKWHTYRMHVKLGSGTGAATLWVDGVKLRDFQGVTPSASDIYGIALGRNVNQGPDHPQSVWWGRIAVYNTDPGWK